MLNRPWPIEQGDAKGAIEARLRTSCQTELRKGILNRHNYERGDNMDECGTNEVPGIQTLSYPGCIEAARAIAPFIGLFDIDSAACAIFCINSWYENRSSQNSAYALNAALLSIKAFGTRKIADYESFSAFFSHIKKALPAPCNLEDEIVPVMGQTLIPFRGNGAGRFTDAAPRSNIQGSASRAPSSTTQPKCLNSKSSLITSTRCRKS